MIHRDSSQGVSPAFACFAASVVLLFPATGYPADTVSVQDVTDPLNLTAILMFLLFVSGTLFITWWAAKRTLSRRDYYAAGGGIPAWQNGVAISGDFLSAASFLGISSALYFTGMDALTLIAGVMISWPIILFLIAERLRNLGRYTFIDVVSFRLAERPVRLVASLGALAVLSFYLIGQLVGAGKLIELLFGINYTLAVTLISILMILYVGFGGMLATTWVQFIKAVLLILGASIVAFATLFHFNFNLDQIFASAAEAHPLGENLLKPGGWLDSPLSVISMGLTSLLGFIGLPHILMRIFTVRDSRAARTSAFYAISIIGYFNILIIIIGIGAVSLIMDNPRYLDPDGNLIGGGNMIVLHITHLLTGNIVLGFLSAVAFATILAVVAGLAMSAAATIAHDLYAKVICRGDPKESVELLISRGTVIAMGMLGIVLGILFEHQNVAFVTNMALAIAGSVNAPVLLASMYWRNLTTRGAIAGSIVGLLSSIIFIILGPQVWVDVIGMEKPLFPYVYPTVASAPMAIFTIWLFSITDKSLQAVEDRRNFDAQFVRSETGIGIDEASSH